MKGNKAISIKISIVHTLIQKCIFQEPEGNNQLYQNMPKGCEIIPVYTYLIVKQQEKVVYW